MSPKSALFFSTSGGYYNQKIYDGLRVISLQTNYANNQN
jgi:hypothetical protein